ncbi:GAF domain-containing sensor histidine kinase [Bradyrhizobium ottawaense]|uniref:GAF domain-containing sensor histidine kinase n=1 Tax=Bradyrhizobium ottawaense TaxID=931866 RepID=UPI003836A994
MAGPAKKGGKTSAGERRKAGFAKGRTRSRTKRPARFRSSTPSEIELKEAREQQAATAEILKVIASSPSDVQPVFEAIVKSAAKLFEPCAATVTTLKDEQLHWGATAASISGFNVERVRSVYPILFDKNRAPSARAILERRIIEIPDVADPNTPEFTRNAAAAGNFRSITFVPLVSQEEGIGTIIFTHPEAGFKYSERQLAFIQTFADQAVIAIQNARLFTETQEALERQKATSGVLQVIGESMADSAPVFERILDSCEKLLQFTSAGIILIDGNAQLLRTARGPGTRILQSLFPQPLDTMIEKAFRSRQPLYTANMAESAAASDIMRQAAKKVGGYSLLQVPMLWQGRGVGFISVSRLPNVAFSDKEVTLLNTFANQAVIAIQNARLFDEVQKRTRDLEESLQQQTATSEVLQAISSSQGDLGPVFDKMLENATRVCGARFGTMILAEGDAYRHTAFYNAPAAYAEARMGKVFELHPLSSPTIAMRGKKVVHLEDVRDGPAYRAGIRSAVELTELAGARTIVVVPMLRDDEAIGVLTVYRQEVRPFSQKQIELLTNFARQAVIAIENARLLRELRQRTDDLSKSLEDLRTAQDRLIQTEKLASLGQLTAGIAHEIKNPLNFVNNFSALSAELIDEMSEVFENPALDEAGRRKELDQIRELLKGNLEKVVQHGKRADSIVKNMLLHSREGSGELRAADINGLVEESLNLAYHGARAEKWGFNIALERQFDATAGEAELFPQEITRALLNLISNGFYAATRRKAEHGGAGAEPTVLATTKNLGSSVEIRIRDNGAGIPPEIREKMFNPFFTTKPTGEGTGLGLSMTHDIIVKQHGGRIDVETRLGEFTEFIITLPRGTGNSGGQKS